MWKRERRCLLDIAHQVGNVTEVKALVRHCPSREKCCKSECACWTLSIKKKYCRSEGVIVVCSQTVLDMGYPLCALYLRGNVTGLGSFYM